MAEKPKGRRVRPGINDGTEMTVLTAQDQPAGSRCVGTVAVVTRDVVTAGTAISWQMDDRAYLGPNEYVLRYIVQGNVLVHQRNECISRMQGDWIMFIDSDMTFQPGAITALVKTREKFDLDMIGGLCFQRTPPYQPTLYVKAANAEHGYTFMESWPDDAAVEVDATGMAFMLVHKRVFDRILRRQTGEGFPEHEERLAMKPPPFFRWEGEYGEDFLFCREAQEAGCRVFVDTSVKVGHVGYTTITEVDFLREVAFRTPEEQAFREAQLASVSRAAITPDEARRRLAR